MDGWRLGYAVASPDLIDALMKITTNEVTHVNTFIQYGALAAVENGAQVLQELVADDRKRRDRFVDGLNTLPGFSCPVPEGTIYVFPDITGTGMASQALAHALFEKAGVVTEAGSFYGKAGEGHLRLCFGSQDQPTLDRAIERMRDYLKN